MPCLRRIRRLPHSLPTNRLIRAGRGVVIRPTSPVARHERRSSCSSIQATLATRPPITSTPTSTALCRPFPAMPSIRCRRVNRSHWYRRWIRPYFQRSRRPYYFLLNVYFLRGRYGLLRLRDISHLFHSSSTSPILIPQVNLSVFSAVSWRAVLPLNFLSCLLRVRGRVYFFW